MLFVDDERPVLEGLGRSLRDEPFQMLFSSTVPGALDVLATKKVDVVVSDDRMPGTSGSEFLRMVRGTYPSVRRILLTGGATLEVAARALHVGELFAFLTKPCEARVLSSMIREALAVGGARRNGSCRAGNKEAPGERQ